MAASLPNFTRFDPLDGYKILNTIVPKYFQTKYPYNMFDADKLTFTQNKIELLAKIEDVAKSGKSVKSAKDKSAKGKSTKDKKSSKAKKSSKTGGSIIEPNIIEPNIIEPITIYG